MQNFRIEIFFQKSTIKHKIQVLHCFQKFLTYETTIRNSGKKNRLTISGPLSQNLNNLHLVNQSLESRGNSILCKNPSVRGIKTPTRYWDFSHNGLHLCAWHWVQQDGQVYRKLELQATKIQDNQGQGRGSKTSECCSTSLSANKIKLSMQTSFHFAFILLNVRPIHPHLINVLNHRCRSHHTRICWAHNGGPHKNHSYTYNCLLTKIADRKIHEKNKLEPKHQLCTFN